MAFTTQNQPANRGRKKGSKNKRSQFSEILTNKALKQLSEAVTQGESWAIQVVINRTHAPLKSITPENSLDAQYLELKMKEISEFDQRIAALEQRNEAIQ